MEFLNDTQILQQWNDLFSPGALVKAAPRTAHQAVNKETPKKEPPKKAALPLRPAGDAALPMLRAKAGEVTGQFAALMKQAQAQKQANDKKLIELAKEEEFLNNNLKTRMDGNTPPDSRFAGLHDRYRAVMAQADALREANAVLDRAIGRAMSPYRLTVGQEDTTADDDTGVPDDTTDKDASEPGTAEPGTAAGGGDG